MNALSTYFSQRDVRLRRAIDADVLPLVDIINEAYAYQDVIKGEPRTNPDHLRQRIAQTNFYILEDDQKLIGCVYLEPQGTALHFGLLTLIPAYRKKGIAADVMAAIEQCAKDNYYITVNLDYMSLAPWLKKYYQRYGFRETGEVQPWGAIDLVRMTKEV